MNFDEYQKRAHDTAMYPFNIRIHSSLHIPESEEPLTKEEIENIGIQIPFVYPLIGLSGEVGELQNKLKKVLRDNKPLARDEINLELGDILWYVSELASIFSMSLWSIAENNINKLESRKERNVIKGSGDDR